MYPRPSMMLNGGHRLPSPIVVGSPVMLSLTQGAGMVQVSGAGDDAFVYLNRPMTDQSHYWEFEVLAGEALPGVTSDIGTATEFGGYPNKNAGVYSASGALWQESGWGGNWSGSSSFGSLSPGANIGFAYFGGEGRLVARLNGDEVREITFSSPPTTLYAHAGFQGVGSGRFRLGPRGCAYPKIPGTNHL